MSEAGAVPAAPGSDSAAVYLGFDFGMRRLGVAVGQRVTLSARPLETVSVQQGNPDWTRVDALLAAWNPSALVVGLPLQLDGSEQAISSAARAFAAALAKRSGRPVHLCDERFSSREAATRFAAQRQVGSKRRHHVADLDAMAAAVILETWLANPHD